MGCHESDQHDVNGMKDGCELMVFGLLTTIAVSYCYDYFSFRVQMHSTGRYLAGMWLLLRAWRKL